MGWPGNRPGNNSDVPDWAEAAVSSLSRSANGVGTGLGGSPRRNCRPPSRVVRSSVVRLDDPAQWLGVEQQQAGGGPAGHRRRVVSEVTTQQGQAPLLGE